MAFRGPKTRLHPTRKGYTSIYIPVRETPLPQTPYPVGHLPGRSPREHSYRPCWRSSSFSLPMTSTGVGSTPRRSAR